MMVGPGKLSGKVVLVTGGASGIGLASAKALAAEGASVAIGDLRGFEDAAVAITELGGRAIGVPLDVTDPTSIDTAIAATVARLGGLNVLVNNAGIGWPKPFAEIDDDEWDQILVVNLKGPFRCSRAALPHLVGGGVIVNLSSMAGRTSSPGMGCHYTASKAGLLGLTRHLARELGPRGIRVNAICPGTTDTPLLRSGYPEERILQFAESIPVGRVGMPEDIARVVVFLSSDDSAYVNGAALDVNGGLFMA